MPGTPMSVLHFTAEVIDARTGGTVVGAHACDNPFFRWLALDASHPDTHAARAPVLAAGALRPYRPLDSAAPR